MSTLYVDAMLTSEPVGREGAHTGYILRVAVSSPSYTVFSFSPMTSRCNRGHLGMKSQLATASTSKGSRVYEPKSQNNLKITNFDCRLDIFLCMFTGFLAQYRPLSLPLRLLPRLLYSSAQPFYRISFLCWQSLPRKSPEVVPDLLQATLPRCPVTDSKFQKIKFTIC